MLKIKTLFALLTVKLLNIEFTASQSANLNMIYFKNKYGNSIYLTLNVTNIEISVYRQTARCYHEFISDKKNINTVIEEIKLKLKL